MDYESELKQLQQEGEMPLDDLLASLPPGMLEDQPPTPPVKGTSMSTKDATEKRETAKDASKGQESTDLTSRRSRKRYSLIRLHLSRIFVTVSNFLLLQNKKIRFFCWQKAAFLLQRSRYYTLFANSSLRP